MESRNCSSCGAPAKGEKCEFCGALIPSVPKESAPSIVVGSTQIAPSSAENQYPLRYQPKDKTTALILAIFLGWLGVHRFYVGKIGTGILMLLVVFCSLGVGWIWTLIDIIMIATDKFKDSNGYPLSQGDII